MNRLSVSWGAWLTTLTLLGCAGNAQDSSSAHAGSGGGGAGGEGGRLTAVCGAANTGGDAGAAGDAGGAGEGGTGGAAPVEELLDTSAWDVTISVSYTQEPGPDLEPFQWSLALDDAAELTALFSRNGQADRLELTRDTGARAHSGSGFSWSVLGLSDAVLETLQLSAFDDDSDGIADRLEGTGEGEVQEAVGDILFPHAAVFTLSGKIDRTPPTPQMPSTRSPLATVDIRMSEALKSASLALTGTSTVPLTVSEGSIQSTRFSTPTVLPFGGSWQVTGEGKDFAGLPLDLNAATLKTLDDPGVFAQDGFETQPLATLGDEVKWIAASDGLPIPTGDHALFLSRGNGATFHLKRSDGNTKVSLNVVGLSKDVWRPTFEVQSAVIGGTQRIELSGENKLTSTTSHPSWTNRSDVRTLQLELEDAGTDVVVQVYVPLCIATVGCPANGALVIDDLHLE
jgi:hypothetical protein